MRTLDSLILDTAQIAPGETVLICNDPTLDLTRAALHAGNPVVFLDPDYARSQAAASMGAVIAGDVRLDSFLAGSEGPAVAVGEMPKALARLDYVARSLAASGFEPFRVVLGLSLIHI